MDQLKVDELKTVETYRKDKCAWFCSKRDPYWELSNIAAIPVVFGAITCNSSEQLYQATKYDWDVECLPEDAKPGTDPNVKRRILAAKNAMGSKMTQKCAVKAGLVRRDWYAPEEMRIHTMLWVLELKLWNNKDTFGAVLKSTGDLPIVEKSRKDNFWGAIPMGIGNMIGCNILGKLLTILRDEKFDKVLKGTFTYPMDGLFLL